LRFLRILW